MSLLFLVSVTALLAAVVLIELRALRAGDERRHHAPGYALVLGGLVLIGIGIAAAISDHAALTLLGSTTGLIVVAFASLRSPHVLAR